MHHHRHRSAYRHCGMKMFGRNTQPARRRQRLAYGDISRIALSINDLKAGRFPEGIETTLHAATAWSAAGVA